MACRPTLWERIADIYLDIRYSDEVPATTRWGRAVSCLSGRTAAYRTQLLQSMREPFLNETFNGTPCMSGDDKRYTCLILQSGYRTWNQLNAQVYSTFNPDFKGFVSSASAGAATASAATCARSGRAGSGAIPTWRSC